MKYSFGIVVSLLLLAGIGWFSPAQAQSGERFTATGLSLDVSACAEKTDAAAMVSPVFKDIRYELDLDSRTLTVSLGSDVNVFSVAVSGKSMVITDKQGRKNEWGSLDIKGREAVYRYKANEQDCQFYIVNFQKQ